MKFFTSPFIALLASVSLVMAQVVNVIPNIPKDEQEVKACAAAASKDTDIFASIRYGQDGQPFSIVYGQCISIHDKHGNVASSAAVCRSATCTIFKTSDCQEAFPIPIDVPTLNGAAALPIALPNVEDFGSLVGASVSCTPNSL